MPLYKNIGNNVEIINNVYFSPLEEKEVLFYIDLEKYPSMKLISEEPIYSPVVFSKIISSGSVKIQENIEFGANSIRLLSKTETSLISFNSLESPKVLLSKNEAMTFKGLEKYNEIFVHDGEVSVEIWREFNWR